MGHNMHPVSDGPKEESSLYIDFSLSCDFTLGLEKNKKEVSSFRSADSNEIKEVQTEGPRSLSPVAFLRTRLESWCVSSGWLNRGDEIRMTLTFHVTLRNEIPS